MENFNIGNLALLGPNVPVSGNGVPAYALEIPIEGLDAPDYRVVNYDSPGQDFGVVSQAFYSSRTLTLKGAIQAANVTSYEASRIALMQAVAINRDSNGYPVLTNVSWTTLAGTEYFINVQFKKPSMAMKNVVYSNFQILAIAPDARIYGAQQVNSGGITVAQGGGFTLPVTLPITFANSSGGGVTMTNNGNMASHPMITFAGPLTNPYIYNSTTGYAFQLDYTIPGGSYVTVDMYNKLVLYNGNQNFIQYVDAVNNNWLTIAPGQNSFVLTTGNAADTGNVDISFYPAYIGI